MQLEGLVIPISFDTGLLLKGIELITGAISGVISDTDEWGNSLDVIQDSLGGTSAEAAGLALAAKKIGMPVEGAVGLIDKMAKGLQDAKGELGPTGKLLESMGIDVLDASGRIRPFNELIGEVATKIAAMPDGLDKTNLEMQIFGRAGAEAGDLMAQLANGGMQNVIDQASAMGLAIDPATVKAFDASWATLQMTLQGFGIKIGAAIMPELQKIIDKIAEFAGRPEIAAFVDSAITSLGQLSDWIFNTGIPAIEEFVSTAQADFADFKESSATESAAIGKHWEEMLGHLSELMNSIFGTEGIDLVINWKQVGITAMQAIDIAIWGIDKSIQGWKMAIEDARRGWEIIREILRDVLNLADEIASGELFMNAGAALFQQIAPGSQGAVSGAAQAQASGSFGGGAWDMNEFIVKLAGELAKVVP